MKLKMEMVDCSFTMTKTYEEGYSDGFRAGLERAAKCVENGRFLNDTSPAFKFAQECAAAIRKLMEE